MTDSSKIKNELQGSGFLDEVKEKRLPDSDMLSAAALEKYENNYAELQPQVVQGNADKILQRLLQYERDIYDEREQRVYREALVVFLEERYDTGQTSLHSFGDSEVDEEFTDYPELQEMFSEIQDIYETSDDFESAFSKILPLLYPAMDAISVSAQQSRRKRAGSSLRKHIENLLKRAGYEIVEKDGAGSGYRYELSPDGETGRIKIYISFLTTLKDRFRQSLSGRDAENDEIPRFIATGSGNSVFTGSSKSDMTQNKVDEITDQGFSLIVFDSLKNNRYPDEEQVISYTDFYGNTLEKLTG